ncbi:MAG: ATP-binding protein [Gammaproteobacteria bacterium]|nr:ATP-binding protein [Gammaproteobacteria bacterium]
MSIKLKDQLHHWIWNGMSGGLILGNYRIGKTRALEYIANQLVNRSGDILPVRRMSISRRDTRTIAGIFKNLSFTLGLKIKPRATSDDMANSVLHHLSELALTNSTYQVVLFVDEMQRLDILQLDAFAELYDSLAELKINLSIIFIGNSAASKPLIDLVLRPKYELIRGRFFTHSFTYHGIRNKNELISCLSEFDTVTTDITLKNSVTKCFLPDEYASGWRLKDLGSLIWKVYERDYRRPLKISSWGMQYFIAAVKILLVDYLPKYGLDDDLLEQMIIQSIEASGLKPNLFIAA